MKKAFALISTLALILFVLSACTQEAVDVKSEIEAMNVSFMEAANNGDTEALTNIYLPDVILCPPNSEMISGVENAVAAMTAMPPGMVKMVFETVSAEAYGETAIELGKYKVMSPDEATVFDHGKYIVIWKKKGDDWKVSKDIWNTSMPLPEPATAEEAEEIVEE
jgi:ketosteroid isomerase-like protein